LAFSRGGAGGQIASFVFGQELAQNVFQAVLFSDPVGFACVHHKCEHEEAKEQHLFEKKRKEGKEKKRKKDKSQVPLKV
jgi:hypothetical protein